MRLSVGSLFFSIYFVRALTTYHPLPIIHHRPFTHHHPTFLCRHSSPNFPHTSHPPFPSPPTLDPLLPHLDVEELHQWHVAKATAHPYFERLTDEQLKDDPAVTAMCEDTEESKKVSRIGGRKYHAVFRRRHESELPVSLVESLFVGGS